MTTTTSLLQITHVYHSAHCPHCWQVKQWG